MAGGLRKLGAAFVEIFADTKKLDADLRRSLARELDHWRSAPAKLEQVMRRSCMLIAARLSDPADLAVRPAAAKSVAKPGAAQELADMAERIGEL